MSDNVSRVVALAWGAEAAPQRGPKRELSLERIVEVAVEIADAEGLQAVTMQRVAQNFGYTTMAMYRYVASKDDLHRLMADAAAVGDLAIDDEDWRTAVEQMVRYLLAVYQRHPWLLDIPISLEQLLMPEQVRFVNAALRGLRTLPASAEDRLLLLTFVSTFARGQASLMREIMRPDASVSEDTKALVRDAVLSGRYPDLAPLVESGVYFGDPMDLESPQDVMAQELTQTLQIWLEGISAVYSGERSSSEDSAPPQPDSPSAALEGAEQELAAVTDLRKATQRRVRELEKREARARKRRDSAKEVAKAAARMER